MGDASDVVTRPQTIQLNPTWKFAARVHIECIKHGDSEEAKVSAELEIMRMASLLDNFVSGEITNDG